jgi:hypothetical protein
LGVASQFSKDLHREMNAYAAWVPVANTFTVGDYGVMSQGLFQRMGNISEFGVQVDNPTSSESVGFDFKSEGSRVVSLVGGAEVPLLPPQPIEAALRVEFTKADSYLVKAAKLSTQELPNLRQLAAQLASANGWDRRHRVVWSTVTAEDALVVMSKEANASFQLNGNADALQQIGLGTVSAELKIASEDKVGLSIVGKTGVVGLRLFKLKLWGSGAKVLGPDGEADIVKDTAEELEDDV